MHKGAWVFALLGALGAVAGCGSEPLDGNDGTGGIPGASGGTSGAAGAPPDFTDTPCYGQAATTLVYSGSTHEVAEVAATCIGEGERTRVYVADTVLAARDRDALEAEVNGFLARFELASGNDDSAYPELGVLPANEAVFGALASSSLADGKLSVFVVDTSGAGEGYLCSWCDTAELHLDAELAPLDGDLSLSIAAHESFHAIHRALDPNETVWVDEVLAEAAMTVNGFYTDRVWVYDFAENPNTSWGPASSDIASFHYGAGLVYGSYLWEVGGAELLRAATQERANGWEGLDAALASIGDDRSAFALFLEAALAFYFDDPERGYGFATLDFDRVPAAKRLAAGESATGTVRAYGLVYVELDARVERVRVEAHLDGPEVVARLATNTDPIEVREVELDTETPLDPTSALLVLTARESAGYTVTAD